MISAGLGREKNVYCSYEISPFPALMRKTHPTGGLLCLVFAGPGEDKSIDQHFFDARPTISPTTRLCLINRIDGSVSRLEGWPGPALRESASAAGYDGKAALGKKGDVSILVFDSTGGHIFIFSVFLSAHRCAPRADPFFFFPPVLSTVKIQDQTKLPDPGQERSCWNAKLIAPLL